VEEVQRGYLLHDRLLRPAKVVVGRAAHDVTPGGA
jgi:molecular chaperone GrpE (heat shock protein)